MVRIMGRTKQSVYKLLYNGVDDGCFFTSRLQHMYVAVFLKDQIA